MLSRRDKLLVKPWEERRYKEHRSKVRSALPAIDDRPPPARPHVALKLKKLQREKERASQVQSENFSLLQRLGAIMKAKRLDNCWEKPLPKLNTKAGAFYDLPSLRTRLTARSDASDAHESYYGNVKCYACERRKKSGELRRYSATSPQFYLPFLYSTSLTRSSQSE